MFDRALTELLQTGRPLPILREIVRHALRKKDVTRIAAIHHPLRQVNACPGDIAAPVHIGHFAHRAAMNPHPHLNLRVLLERFPDLERALRRFLRTIAKDQRHSIAGRQPHQLLVRRPNDLCRRQHDIGELPQSLVLLFDQELGITHKINEQDVPDLQPKIVLRFRRHMPSNFPAAGSRSDTIARSTIALLGSES